MKLERKYSGGSENSVPEEQWEDWWPQDTLYVCKQFSKYKKYTITIMSMYVVVWKLAYFPSYTYINNNLK